MANDTKGALAVFGGGGGAGSSSCDGDDVRDGGRSAKKPKAVRKGSRKAGGFSARQQQLNEHLATASRENMVGQKNGQDDRLMLGYRMSAIWNEELARHGYITSGKLSVWELNKFLCIYDRHIQFGEDFVWRYLRWLVKNWSSLAEKFKFDGTIPHLQVVTSSWGNGLSQMFYVRWKEKFGLTMGDEPVGGPGVAGGM